MFLELVQGHLLHLFTDSFGLCLSLLQGHETEHDFARLFLRMVGLRAHLRLLGMEMDGLGGLWLSELDLGLM